MSGLQTLAKPYRIKAAHRRRGKVASGPIVQRYYDPILGRFLSPDPVQASDNGASFNRYWYANNNPYKFTDKDGREAGGGYCDGSYQLPPETARNIPPAMVIAVYGAALEVPSAIVGGVKLIASAFGKGGDTPSAPTSRGVDTGELHAPGDVQNSTVVVRGGASEPPAGGTTYSGSQGTTVADAAKGVPHGQIRATTAGTIRAAGGKVDVAPEPMKSGAINGQHVNVTEAPGASSLGELQPNPVPKPDRLN